MLKDQEGNWRLGWIDLRELFLNHLKKIYTFSNPLFMPKLSNLLPLVNDIYDNSFLCNIPKNS